jgi:two-component system response regulator EvgA
MARILIADDHAVVRMAVSLSFEKAGHEVVGEASNGVDVITLARQLEPSLIILDIDLPVLDGFAVLKRLCGDYKNLKVLVFSGLKAEQYAIRCSRAGASGFVSKEGAIADLITAAQIVLAGYTLFPATSLSSVNASAQLSSEEDAIKTLSGRELSVLRYLARGYRIKDIASEMLMSQKTASTYKARLILKLQVSNQVELVELVKRNGLV